MKPHLPLALAGLAAVAVAGTAVAAPALAKAPAAPTTEAMAATPTVADQDRNAFAWTDWDDDDDDRRRYGPMPRPDVRALRDVGIVRVIEVDRDDGRIEVEGYDSRGRRHEALMDRHGRRVIDVRRDRGDDDDRDDDDRWDD